MRRYTVKSRNLLEVGYDPLKSTLEVVFRADPRWIYTYQHVPVMKFAKLLTATSIGGFFSSEIRSQPKRFPYTKRKAKRV